MENVDTIAYNIYKYRLVNCMIISSEKAYNKYFGELDSLEPR